MKLCYNREQLRYCSTFRYTVNPASETVHILIITIYNRYNFTIQTVPYTSSSPLLSTPTTTSPYNNPNFPSPPTVICRLSRQPQSRRNNVICITRLRAGEQQLLVSQPDLVSVVMQTWRGNDWPRSSGWCSHSGPPLAETCSLLKQFCWFTAKVMKEHFSSDLNTAEHSPKISYTLKQAIHLP